jgi:hypothetical protein
MVVTGVRLADSEAFTDALLSAERPDATRLTIPGMNHVLKMAPADRAGQQDAYSNPHVPLAAGVSDAIADFVRQAAH